MNAILIAACATVAAAAAPVVRPAARLDPDAVTVRFVCLELAMDRF